VSSTRCPSHFNINDYCNWVPSHHWCNNNKNRKPLGASPLTQRLLERLQEDAEKRRRIEEKFKSDRSAAKTLGRFMVAVEKAPALAAQLRESLLAITVEDKELFQQAREHLSYLLSDEWRIVSLEGNVAAVTDRTRWGTTFVGSGFNSSWSCPTCGRPGPWRGVICLSCGRKSDPND
jgi:hypothetical protein